MINNSKSDVHCPLVYHSDNTKQVPDKQKEKTQMENEQAVQHQVIPSSDDSSSAHESKMRTTGKS